MKNNHWETIQGWFDFANIYDIAVEKTIDGSVLVEVGTWLGKSTCYLAQKLKEKEVKVRFYACDKFERPHDNDGAFLKMYPDLTNWIFYDRFIENIRKQEVMDIVTPVMANSLDFVKMFDSQSIDFLFLDDNHMPAHVLLELQLWYPKMKIGSIMAGHDKVPVQLALDEFKKLQPNFDYILDGNSWISVIKEEYKEKENEYLES